jgi:hypothetical protein
MGNFEPNNTDFNDQTLQQWFSNGAPQEAAGCAANITKVKLKTKTKIRGFGPRANYADREIAACW